METQTGRRKKVYQRKEWQKKSCQMTPINRFTGDEYVFLKVVRAVLMNSDLPYAPICPHCSIFATFHLGVKSKEFSKLYKAFNDNTKNCISYYKIVTNKTNNLGLVFMHICITENVLHHLIISTPPPQHRNYHHHPIRFSLGGGLVAWLPHSWGHHPALRYTILVPASLPACGWAPGPRQMHGRADKVH